MLKGIDISKWQKGIKLSSLTTDFVICKATEGVGYVDTTCDTYYQEAKRLNKKRGVYHFARPDLGNSGTAEANYFLEQTKGYWKDSLLILDWEPQGSSIGNVAWAKEWLDRVYKVTGVRPLIYMSASVMSRYNWSSVANANYGLWLANYGSNNGNIQESVFNRYPLKYWTFYALWQYTSKGRLSGYNGNLDMNIFSGSEETWDKYSGAYQKEPVEPPRDDCKEKLEALNKVVEQKSKEIDTLKSELESKEEYIKDLQEVNTLNNSKITMLNALNKELNSKVAQLHKEIENKPKQVFKCEKTGMYKIKLYENENLFIK